MTTKYTVNFRFALPDFRMGPWHDLINDDIVAIDALLLQIMQGVDTRPWENSTDYTLGMTVIDTTDHTYWVTTENHTSAAWPATMADDRAAHPNYWTRIVAGIAPRGEWQNSTQYNVNDLVQVAMEGIIAIAIHSHMSSPVPYTIRDDAQHWVFLTDFHGTRILAKYIVYEGSVYPNVQVALDQLFSYLGGPVGWDRLPVDLRKVPIVFPFQGKPASVIQVNVPMSMPVTIPANLAGTTVYSGTLPTVGTTFTINKIDGANVATSLGTVTITSVNHTSCTLAGSGGSLAAGEVLQIVTPGTDVTLADVGITILAMRV